MNSTFSSTLAAISRSPTLSPIFVSACSFSSCSFRCFRRRTNREERFTLITFPDLGFPSPWKSCTPHFPHKKTPRYSGCEAVDKEGSTAFFVEFGIKQFRRKVFICQARPHQGNSNPKH